MISMKMRSMAAFVIVLVLTGSIRAQDSSASNEETSQAAGSAQSVACLLYTSPSPRDLSTSRMPSSA